MPQSLAQVWLHVVFSTKDRRAFLQNAEFRDEMFIRMRRRSSSTGLGLELSPCSFVNVKVASKRTNCSAWAKDAPSHNAAKQIHTDRDPQVIRPLVQSIAVFLRS